MLAQGYQLEIGAKAPGFKGLPGVDGKTYSLETFSDASVLLVVFSCNHCPYVKAYEGRMEQVWQDYREKGVAMVAINSNDAVEYPEDSFEEMGARAKDQGLTFPYVRDEDQSVAEAYGAVCTPHVLIFDEDRILRYQGRYDGEKDDPDKGNAQDVRDALEALLAGENVATPVTRAFGCSVKWGRQHFTKLQS